MQYAAFLMEAIRRPPRVIHVHTACRLLHNCCVAKRSHWFCRISVMHGEIMPAWSPRPRSTKAVKACIREFTQGFHVTHVVASAGFNGMPYTCQLANPESIPESIPS